MNERQSRQQLAFINQIIALLQIFHHNLGPSINPHMESFKPLITPPELETQRSGHYFGGELKQLRRYIYSPSICNTQIYDFILGQYHTQFDREEGVALALCLMFIAIEALSQARKNDRLSEVAKWKQQLQSIEKHTSETIKQSPMSTHRCWFYRKLKAKTSIQQLRQDYIRYLQVESPFIYKASQTIWRLLQFQCFCSQNIHHSLEDQNQINNQLNCFQAELLRKQNQLRLNAHIEQCIRDDSEGQVLKSMMKTETFLPSRSHSKMPSFPIFGGGFTAKQMMIMEICLDTIDLVERCETYECPYLLFHIPFLYLLAEVLSYYRSGQQELYIYRIFTTLCTKVSKVKNSSNPQLHPTEIADCLLDFISFRKITGKQHLEKLAAFLNRHKDKMSTFIPVYFEIFSFHAFDKYSFVQKLFAQEMPTRERRKQMKARLQLIHENCSKYNNEAV